MNSNRVATTFIQKARQGVFLALFQAIVADSAFAQPQVTPIPDGNWQGTYSCGPVLTPNAKEPAPFSVLVSMKTESQHATILRETKFTRGSMTGAIGAGGRTVLTGNANRLDNPSDAWRFRFEGNFVGPQFQATGVIESIDGRRKFRDCTLSLALVAVPNQVLAPAESKVIVGNNTPLMDANRQADQARIERQKQDENTRRMAEELAKERAARTRLEVEAVAAKRWAEQLLTERQTKAEESKRMTNEPAKEKSKDLPINITQGMPYVQARTALTKNGWQTVAMHTLPNLTPTCWKNYDHDISWKWPKDGEGAESCKYEEIESCSGTGMGFCSMFFFDGSGKYLRLITAGGEPPAASVNRWSIEPKLPEKIENKNAVAAQFESVIDAMAIKSSDRHTNNSWEEIAKIKGAEWKWPYYESGAHVHTMVGRTKVGEDKNPNIGATRIEIRGARTFITNISIYVDNLFPGIEAFGKGDATKISTSCDVVGAGNSVEFYKFEKPGYKPLYMLYTKSSGAGGSGGVEFNIAYDLAVALNIQLNPCKPLDKTASEASQTASDVLTQEQAKAKTAPPTQSTSRNDSFGVGNILIAGIGGAFVAGLMLFGFRRLQRGNTQERKNEKPVNPSTIPSSTQRADYTRDSRCTEASSTGAQTNNPVDNTFVWLLVAVPIVGTVIENAMGGGSVAQHYLWIGYIVINTVLCIVDERRLKAASHRTPNVVWVLLVPVYLWIRASRLRHPPYYFWAWLVAFAASVYVEMANVGGTLPNCDDKEVVAMAEKVIRDAPLIKLSGFQVKGISMPAERRYDARNESRLCRAMLSHALGEEAIQYTVEWHDKKKRLIWVQLVDQ